MADRDSPAPAVGVTDAELIAQLRARLGHATSPELSALARAAADRLEALTQPSGKVSDEWVRDAAMNVMLATEVDEATRILRAAVEAAQLPARPVVKALEWDKTSYGRPEVATVVGVYRVHEHVSGGWGATFRSACLVDQYGRQNFATEAGAIAACEADYERRIRSALEGEGE